MSYKMRQITAIILLFCETSISVQTFHILYICELPFYFELIILFTEIMKIFLYVTF